MSSPSIYRATWQADTEIKLYNVKKGWLWGTNKKIAEHKTITDTNGKKHKVYFDSNKNITARVSQVNKNGPWECIIQSKDGSAIDEYVEKLQVSNGIALNALTTNDNKATDNIEIETIDSNDDATTDLSNIDSNNNLPSSRPLKQKMVRHVFEFQDKNNESRISGVFSNDFDEINNNPSTIKKSKTNNAQFTSANHFFEYGFRMLGQSDAINHDDNDSNISNNFNDDEKERQIEKFHVNSRRVVNWSSDVRKLNELLAIKSGIKTKLGWHKDHSNIADNFSQSNMSDISGLGSKLTNNALKKLNNNSVPLSPQASNKPGGYDDFISSFKKPTHYQNITKADDIVSSITTITQSVVPNGFQASNNKENKIVFNAKTSNFNTQSNVSTNSTSLSNHQIDEQNLFKKPTITNKVIETSDWLEALDHVQSQNPNVLLPCKFALSLQIQQGKRKWGIFAKKPDTCELNKQDKTGAWMESRDADFNQQEYFSLFVSNLTGMKNNQVACLPITVVTIDKNGKKSLHDISIVFKRIPSTGNLRPYCFDCTYKDTTKPAFECAINMVANQLTAVQKNSNKKVKLANPTWLTGTLKGGINACAPNNVAFVKLLAQNPKQTPTLTRKQLKTQIAQDKNAPRKQMARYLGKNVL